MRAETSVNKINRFMAELGKAVGSPGLFRSIESGLIRFPAIDAAGLREHVNAIVSTH